MSTASDLGAAFFPDGYRLRLGCVALIVYEYLLTFEAERRVIWPRKLTVPTALFLLNRYCLILFGLSTCLWFFVRYDDDRVTVLHHILGVFVGAIGTVFQALRIHCINGRKWFWTVALLILGFVPTMSIFLDMIVTHPVALPSPLTGCLGSKYISSGDVWTRKVSNMIHSCSVTTAITLIAYTPDVLVVGITWYRTARLAYAARGVDLGRPSIGSLLLRDGTTFLVANLIVDSVVVYCVLAWQVALSEVALTMWSVLMSRFILNLRQTADQSVGFMSTMSVGAASGATSEPLRFASILFDNLGAPLDLDDEDDRPTDEGIGMTDRRPSCREGGPTSSRV